MLPTTSTTAPVNALMIATAGAADMAHPAMIAACRMCYRVAPLVGDSLLAGLVRRAWNRGDSMMVHSHLTGLVMTLADMEGTWDLWVEARTAAAALDALVA